MFPGKTIADHIQTIWALGPVTPSTSTPDYISLKDYHSVEAVIIALNGTTVTGSAITLLQASAVAGTGAKALAFSYVFANTDCGASATLVNTAVTSNTFTTSTTNSKVLMYRIPIDPATLDMANSYDCIRVATADAANTSVCVFYNCVPRFGGNAVLMPAGITD